MKSWYHLLALALLANPVAAETPLRPPAVPPLPQTGVAVLPKRTIARFADERVAVTLTFLTPALPDQLDVLARPVTYIVWEVAATDGRPHAVALDRSCDGRIAVNSPEQPVAWDEPAVRVGS